MPVAMPRARAVPQEDICCLALGLPVGAYHALGKNPPWRSFHLRHIHRVVYFSHIPPTQNCGWKGLRKIE